MFRRRTDRMMTNRLNTQPSDPATSGDPTYEAPSTKARAARRPTRVEAQAIHEAVLSAARAEFIARGFAGARIDAIATMSNVTRATLYGRFESKEALFRAVAEEHFTTWTVANYIESVGGGLEQRLRARARAFAITLTEPGAQIYRQLLSAAEQGYPEFASSVAYQRGYLRMRDDLTRDILQSPRGKSISAATAIEISEFLIASIYGWINIEVASGALTRKRALAYADRVVDMALTQLPRPTPSRTT